MPHNRYDNFGQGQGQGGMGAITGGNPFTGGMFGPVGGPQNIGGGMSPQEQQALMAMYQSQIGGGGQMMQAGGGSGPTLPQYNPALAGPTGVPGIDASGLGIDTAGLAPGGAAGMDFGTGAITAGVDSIGDAAMYAWQQEQMEKRRLAEMLAMGGGVGGGPTPASTAAFGMGSSGDQFFR